MPGAERLREVPGTSAEVRRSRISGLAQNRENEAKAGAAQRNAVALSHGMNVVPDLDTVVNIAVAVVRNLGSWLGLW